MKTMKAVSIYGYGGPSVLHYEDAPKPHPGTGEVLVRVHAAGVNPIDWKIREGELKGLLAHTFPLILGWDVSGTVEALGAGVLRFKVGDEVYSRPDILRDGAYAEFVVIRESEVALKPKAIDHIHAAAMPLDCLAAWQTLIETAALAAGQRVLIHAGSGGVGHFAVQIARARGAFVIATTSARNHAFVRDLGVEQVVDYDTERFEEVVRPVDVVLDTVGGDTQTRSWKVVKEGGMLVSLVSEPDKVLALAHHARGAFVFAQPNAAQLAEIAILVEDQRLKAVVETILALSDATRAQELSQRGHTVGKIVLRVVP